ncbi:unnamed protein product [Caenorhabditis auriculariae]|uniref:Uncharacterized protein n=1 Tax=Caenorhabditis auriculariae TaxID=2777116 RepID=A0A8S1HL42_9PELO|nr:unnamed protein product [Caenorhabditis auriculariae]
MKMRQKAEAKVRRRWRNFGGLPITQLSRADEDISADERRTAEALECDAVEEQLTLAPTAAKPPPDLRILIAVWSCDFSNINGRALLHSTFGLRSQKTLRVDHLLCCINKRLQEVVASSANPKTYVCQQNGPNQQNRRRSPGQVHASPIVIGITRGMYTREDDESRRRPTRRRQRQNDPRPAAGCDRPESWFPATLYFPRAFTRTSQAVQIRPDI